MTTTYDITIRWSGWIPANLTADVSGAVGDCIEEYVEVEHVWTKVRDEYTITRVKLGSPIAIAALAALIIKAIMVIAAVIGIYYITHTVKEVPEAAAIGLGALIVIAIILYMLSER